MTKRRKRLIEVAFPLEEVSRTLKPREKSFIGATCFFCCTFGGHGARLAACRAFIYASLVDDPDTEAPNERNY